MVPIMLIENITNENQGEERPKLEMIYDLKYIKTNLIKKEDKSFKIFVIQTIEEYENFPQTKKDEIKQERMKKDEYLCEMEIKKDEKIRRRQERKEKCCFLCNCIKVWVDFFTTDNFDLGG
jgi:chloramphenicol O-acetyltransferase